VATRLHGFLGVTPRPEDGENLPPLNAGLHAQTIDPAIHNQLAVRYAEPNKRLTALLGPDFPMWDR
jgi:hypothetical protein